MQSIHRVRRATLLFAAPFACLAAACSGGVQAGSPSDASSADASRSSSSDAGADAATGESDASTKDAATTDAGGHPVCIDGGLGFKLNVATPSSVCLGKTATCDDEWLSIAPANGLTIARYQAFCGLDCSTCSSLPCPPVPACLPPPSAPAVVATTWDGTYYPEATCLSDGGAASCSARACAMPGTYVATMCVHEPNLDAGSSEMACVGASASACTSVQFDWPPSSSAPVVGTITSLPDGG